MAEGWSTSAAILFVACVLAGARLVSADFERAKSCPDGLRNLLDLSKEQRAWLHTGDVEVNLGSAGECQLPKDTLFKARVKDGRITVRKETKPKSNVCDLSGTSLPASEDTVFVSCESERKSAQEEFRVLMHSLPADSSKQNRMLILTTESPSDLLLTTELSGEAELPTEGDQLEADLPASPTPSTKPSLVTEMRAPAETVLPSVKLRPAPTVLSTEIKVLSASLPVTVATVSAPPMTTTALPRTHSPITTEVPSTLPPTTATEVPVTTPPPTTTTVLPTTTHPPTTSVGPMTEEDADRTGARSGTPSSQEVTHMETKSEDVLKKYLPYFLGGAAGVFVLILLIIVVVALSTRRRKRRVSQKEAIVLGSANYRRQQDDTDNHDLDHVNIMMYSADEQEETPHQSELEERILKPPEGLSSTPATPKCLRDKNFD